MSFRFLEHVADVLFEATGKTFEEALESAADAVSAAAAENVKAKERFEFEESAANVEELVVAMLQRFLVESDVRTLQPAKMKVTAFSEAPGKVYAKAVGWAGKGTAKTIIKGVTYGMLKAEKLKGNKGWKLQVLLDI